MVVSKPLLQLQDSIPKLVDSMTNMTILTTSLGKYFKNVVEMPKWVARFKFQCQNYLL